jgi:serine/threonine-protein kinase
MFVATRELVALKHVVSRSDDDLARFRHEAEIQARVRHENVLALLDVSMRPGELFLVTELADGSLRDLLDRTPQMPVGIALLVTREVLRGLAAAQSALVLHRDVKPHNVLLLADGRVKVADFGVAKASHQTALTATGSVVGTPAYMSPEQALGLPLDGRSDLFSVGPCSTRCSRAGTPGSRTCPPTRCAASWTSCPSRWANAT